MKSYKSLYYSLLILLITSYAVISGCTSAESTTGKLAFQNKDYAKAEVELKKGLQVDKNDDEGWYMLGVSQVELGKFEDAKTSFKNSLNVSKNFSSQITSYWIEKFNQGASQFEQGIKAEERKDVTSAQKFYTNALSSFTASSVIIPDSLKSYRAMAETYLALNQRDKAMEMFSNILAKSNTPEIAERVAKIMFDSGLNMLTMKNYADASSTFKSIIGMSSLSRKSPYYETSVYNYSLSEAKLGEAERDKNNADASKTHFRNAQSSLESLTTNLNKKDLEYQIYDLLVAVYANLGETQKAEDALKKKETLKR